MSHEQEIQFIFKRACEVLKLDNFKFKIMRQQNVRINARSFAIGRTNLKTKTVSLDIYTPKQRRAKKISALLSIMAHELAHHQKPPFRQRFRGRIINRIHFPVFYRRVSRNIKKFKKDKILKQYYK